MNSIEYAKYLKEKEMNTTSWNKYLAETWGNYLPPIRPYFEELDIFRKHIIEYKSINPTPSVLILGSTPELRDLVNNLKLIPTIVDYSEKNYIAMGMLKKTDGSENFINLNWLDFTPNQQFDIILSEAAFNVLDAESSKILYSKCRSWLKASGKLLAKNWVRISNHYCPINELITNFRQSLSNHFGFYSSTCIPLMLCFYDYTIERITLKNFNNECQKLFENGRITREEWDTISVHSYENVDLQLYIPDVYDFINDIVNLFYIEQIYDIKVAYSEYHPIFILSRR
jgi:hypothetical protein